LTNTSIKAANGMYSAGVEELKSDVNGIMAFFTKKADEALAMLDRTQSDAIRSGYITDDARDFNAATEDLCKDMTQNFTEMICKIQATTKAVTDKVNSADNHFERVEKDQIPLAVVVPNTENPKT
jgi:hypothetical protein